jgi:hypothetical protein
VTADDLIFSVPGAAGRSAEDWDLIEDRLVKTLGEALELPLEVTARYVIDDVALSLRVKTAQSVGGPLAIGLTATIGIQMIDKRPYVNALVFLFTDQTRLCRVGEAGSFAELLYDAGGRWRFNGWAVDEYGEFTNRPPP